MCDVAFPKRPRDSKVYFKVFLNEFTERKCTSSTSSPRNRKLGEEAILPCTGISWYLSACQAHMQESVVCCANVCVSVTLTTTSGC